MNQTDLGKLLTKIAACDLTGTFKFATKDDMILRIAAWGELLPYWLDYELAAESVAKFYRHNKGPITPHLLRQEAIVIRNQKELQSERQLPARKRDGIPMPPHIKKQLEQLFPTLKTSKKEEN